MQYGSNKVVTLYLNSILLRIGATVAEHPHFPNQITLRHITNERHWSLKYNQLARNLCSYFFGILLDINHRYFNETQIKTDNCGKILIFSMIRFQARVTTDRMVIKLKRVYSGPTSHGGWRSKHYGDVIISAMASQITGLTIVFLIVYSGADQRKYQSSASLAFVREIHQ